MKNIILVVAFLVFGSTAQAFLIDRGSFAYGAERMKNKKSKEVAIKIGGVVVPQNNAKGKKRPNVLFIICDDLNTHVTPSGYKPIKTPALDRLASEGMTFGRAYCQYPVCGPSRASLLSGLYPQSTGVLSNKADIRQARPGTSSLPQQFKEAGYWTASVGKVFHNVKLDHGDTAWDHVLRYNNDELPLVTEARKAFVARHGSIEGKNRKLWKEKLSTLGTQARNQNPPGYGRSGLTDAQHRDGKNATQIISWLRDKAYGDKPFLMMCGIQKPHVPFLAPDKYFDMYPKSSLKYTPDPADHWDHIPKIAMVERYRDFGFKLGVENDDLRREYMQAYHACITFIDTQIGRIFDALKTAGHWEDTIIVLTSDHGYHLGEHFLWGKVSLFEVCDRVPLLVRVPGMTNPGSRSTGLVELLDLYPTLMDLCGIDTPDYLQGCSIVPMLEDATAPGKEAAYTVVMRGEFMGKAIRTGPWRYARWPGGEELYNLDKDPREQKNLVRSSEHAAILKQMRNRLYHIDANAQSKLSVPFSLFRLFGL